MRMHGRVCSSTWLVPPVFCFHCLSNTRTWAHAVSFCSVSRVQTLSDTCRPAKIVQIAGQIKRLCGHRLHEIDRRL